MPDTRTSDRRQTEPAPPHPPFHIILSYLLGAWADLRVVDPARGSTVGRETRR